MYRRTILLLMLVMACCTVWGADTDELEIVASKPRGNPEELWKWHADLTNLYGDVGNILGGSQVEVDLLDFPSGSDGEWQEMFRLEYETNTLVTTDVTIEVSPFMDMDDETVLHPVEFRMDADYSYVVPAGFSDSFTVPADETRSGKASSIHGYGEYWTFIDVAAMTPISDGDDGWGFFSATLTVEGRFTEEIEAEDILGTTWVMPVAVTMILESE